MKKGLDTATKCAGIPMAGYKQMTIEDRIARHKINHPNDIGVPKENKGVTWSKKTDKDKKLDEFYETHIYTFVDEKDLTKKRWVRIAGFEEEPDGVVYSQGDEEDTVIEEYLEKKEMLAQIVGEEE